MVSSCRKNSSRLSRIRKRKSDATLDSRIKKFEKQERKILKLLKNRSCKIPN